MFLSAGLIAESLGHDRIAELGGAARAMPVTFLALGLGGLSLMGLPPSGGFAAKWLLMKASIESGQWVWADRHGGWRTAGGRISLSRAGPGAFGREPATEESARAQPRERRAGSGACRAPARLRAADRSSPSCRSAVRPQASRCNERAGATVRSSLAGRHAGGAARRSRHLPRARLARPGARDHAARRARPRSPPPRSRLAARRSAPSCPRCA